MKRRYPETVSDEHVCHGISSPPLPSPPPPPPKDYDHELVCITEREKFVLPVKAIGSRALLDFPDEIHFSAAPVKVSYTLFVFEVLFQ